MTPGEKVLTELEALLVQYRASGKSVIDAAKLAGVPESTAYRWFKQAHVQEALRQAKEHLLDDVKTKVTRHFESLVDKAMDAVEHCVEDEEVPAAVRLKAAQLVLDRAVPMTQASPGEQENPQEFDVSLMRYMSDEELDQFEGILERARARKHEAEGNVTPIRRQA